MKHFIKLFFILTLFLGCSSDDSNNSETPDDSTNIIVESTNVKSFELVTLTIENSELLDTYQGTFGDKEITINKVDENSLAFLVPDIPSGNHTLNFDIGNKEFNVTETLVSNPEETISNVFDNFNTDISALDNSNSYIEQEIQNAMSYFSEVQDLYNSLTTEQKRQVALYYEANKETFQNFKNNVNFYIDAPTTMSRIRQSQCQQTSTNFKQFYSCTANNLGESSIELKNSAKEVLQMLGLAGAAIVVSPSTVGVSLAAAGIATATAVYILLAETVPAAIIFGSSVGEFVKANWIFTQATFQTVATVFTSESVVNLNSQPTYRSINSNDENISTETSFFISSYAKMTEYWNKLSALFPSMPTYQNSSEIVAFDDNEDVINITNISNSNVQLVSQNGQNVEFKSLSGNDETFSFDMEIVKEGFSLVETINNATVYAENNNQVEGWYQVNYFLQEGSGSSCSPQIGKEIKFYVLLLETNGSFTGTIYYKEVDDVLGIPESTFIIQPFEPLGTNQLASSSENFIGDSNNIYSRVWLSLYINMDGTNLQSAYGINMNQNYDPNVCYTQSYGSIPVQMTYIGLSTPSDI
ncbi:MAG: hypothetical protein H6604_09775 [Flavobacteriales bacterium]|nr:hypothetical protein [Flavobacteriales bacterium]